MYQAFISHNTARQILWQYFHFIEKSSDSEKFNNLPKINKRRKRLPEVRCFLPLAVEDRASRWVHIDLQMALACTHTWTPTLARDCVWPSLPGRDTITFYTSLLNVHFEHCFFCFSLKAREQMRRPFNVSCTKWISNSMSILPKTLWSTCLKSLLSYSLQ